MIGSSQYIYDIIKKREYPEGFVIGKFSDENIPGISVVDGFKGK